MAREVKVGCKYRHFKGRIIGVSKNTETGEELMIYKPLYETDCIEEADYAARPFDMFTSEVDHEKYPNIKQKYRFELVNDKLEEE